MKNIFTALLFFISISLFSQDENQFKVIDFASGDYPVGEKVKILFDKDWSPLNAIDSAYYYRNIKFKEKNIPSGMVVDYFITGEKQSSFFATYVGLSEEGLDSVQINGPSYFYHINGNKSMDRFFLNNIQVGEEKTYYESGAVKYKANWVDNLKQGEEIAYYESGAVDYKANYVDDLAQGEEIAYYESGEVEYKRNWVDDLAQGEQIGYYESGEVEYKRNWVDDLKQGEEIFYFKSGQIDYTKLWNKGDLKERKLALVIGNALYEKGPLKNPVNDANLIAKSLEKLDFEVLLHTNLATEDEMLDAIKDFGRKRNNYEVAFIYYAGHGIQLNNKNYLLPVNEEFEFEDDVEDNGVSMQRVLRYLESTRENQLNIIVLDACRDNPFESNWNKTRSIKGGGLAKIPPPTGSLIAFSTDHGQTAADGDGGNSLYSQALAEKLLEENVSIEQVFKNVRTEVLKLSGNTQSPVEESKLTGDVYYLNKTEN